MSSPEKTHEELRTVMWAICEQHQGCAIDAWIDGEFAMYGPNGCLMVNIEQCAIAEDVRARIIADHGPEWPDGQLQVGIAARKKADETQWQVAWHVLSGDWLRPSRR